MKGIFVKNQNPYQLRDNSRHENDLINPDYKAFTYGECSLKLLGPKVWNAQELKNADSLFTFKKLIKTWDRPNCECKSTRTCCINNCLLTEFSSLLLYFNNFY